MERIKQLIIDNPSLEFLENEPMKNHTNYKVGGRARYFMLPNDTVILEKIINIVQEDQIEYFVLGNGSNILFGDKDFDGVVICLKRFVGYKLEDDLLYVKSGYMIPKLANEMAKLGLSGLEFLSGVPGTIGGAIYMNAGAYNKEIADMIVSVDIIECGKLITVDREHLSFSYRTSNLQKDKGVIVLGATLQMTKKDSQEIFKLMNERRERRVKSQPYDKPCAGSVFRNPEFKFSWQLIEQCGLRGYQIGGAQVSTLHTNFIVNVDQASASDVLALIKYVQEVVYKETGIHLETEVELVNW